jgi:hypothetical protein
MLLALKGDRNQSAKVVGVSPDFGPMRLISGGVPEPVAGPPVIMADGKTQTMRFSSRRAAKEYLRSLRKKGINVTVNRAEAYAVFPKEVAFEIVFGGSDCFRSAAKTALTFLSWQRRSGGMAEALLWSYVATGKCAAVTANCTPAPRPWPLPRAFEVLCHQLTIESDASGRLRIDVRYFSDLAIRLEVQGSTSGTPWRLGYAVDPFTGVDTFAEQSISPLSGVPSLKDAPATQAAMRTTMTAILRRWHREARIALLRELLRGISRGSLRERWSAVRTCWFALRRQDHARPIDSEPFR